MAAPCKRCKFVENSASAQPAATTLADHWLKQAREVLLNGLKDAKIDKEPQSLYEPIAYLLNLGGKRLRPLLALLGYSLYEQKLQEALPCALAVEVFHNFTLMHDDIMDKAPLRRGKLTVHTKYNVNTAILSGDAMMVQSYQHLQRMPAEQLPQLLSLFNKTALEVCEGQQYDMDFESQAAVTAEEYLEMIRLKTAVLLGCSLKMGAIAANAPANEADALYKFGVGIGVGFQLMDDWLDLYGNTQKVGKQVGGDVLSNKKTYLLIYAQQQLKGDNLKELNSLYSNTLFVAADKLKRVKALFAEAGAKEATRALAEKYFTESYSYLNNLPSASATAVAHLHNYTAGLAARDS